MHKMRLVTAAAVTMTLAASVVATAAPNSKPAAAKPAAKTASAKFDQAAVLKKFRTAPDSTVVATVNGESITKGQLMQTLWDWMAPYALNEMINQKMVAQGAKKAGATLSAKDLQAKIAEAKSQMPGDYREVLRRANATEDYFVATTRTRALAEAAVQKQIKATDAEYAQFVKARHILIRFPQTETDKTKAEADAQAKAKKVYDEIKAGKDFAAAAKEYSEDPGSKDQGGDLGWFKKGRMIKDFEDKAFSMKAGEISEPVKTFYGYHIIQVQKLGKDASGAEKQDLAKQIKAEQMPPMLQKWFSDVRTGAKVDNKINPALPAPAMPGMPAGHPAP